MKLDEAKTIATKWVRYLSPSCERVEDAGSVRRGKPDVKDIEIVCMPKIRTEKDLFGNDGAQVSLLELFFESSLFRVTAARFVKNGPRYKQLVLVEGINLDLFIVLPPAQFGVIFLIRTGPAEYGHKLVTHKAAGGLLPSYLRVKDGAIWSNNHIIETPEEADVFELIGVPYAEPKDRQT